MIHTLLIGLTVTCCIVFIWDYTGFVAEAADSIVSIITGGKIKHVRLKRPLSCSLCMTTWITLVLLLILDWRLAPMCFVYAFLTPHILSIFQIIDMALERVLMWIQEALTK